MISTDRMPDVAMKEVSEPEPSMQTEIADRINNCAISIEIEIKHVQEMLQRLEV